LIACSCQVFRLDDTPILARKLKYLAGTVVEFVPHRNVEICLLDKKRASDFKVKRSFHKM